MTWHARRPSLGRLVLLAGAGVLLLAGSFSGVLADPSEWRGAITELPRVRAALPPDAIRHVLVIDLENESFATTFGPTSPATYLNTVLLKQGELIDGYFATGHASLDNYISQISGQSPNNVTKADCSNLASLTPPFTARLQRGHGQRSRSRRRNA